MRGNGPSRLHAFGTWLAAELVSVDREPTHEQFIALNREIHGILWEGVRACLLGGMVGRSPRGGMSGLARCALCAA